MDNKKTLHSPTHGQQNQYFSSNTRPIKIIRIVQDTENKISSHGHQK